MSDTAHMMAALALAARGLGETWPNPSVGCVIVRDGRVVGRGRTASGGRPHAETEALAMAGVAARGATAYVTLEPCSHEGQTPPCAGALIAAGVARVVAALRDPDERVNGAGLAALRAAGLAVEDGVLAAEAARVTAGFLSRVRHGRPLVTLKLATTLDGRIATAGGESRWITGAPARRAAHALRAEHDAILVGVGTVLADDPRLTCRLSGARRRPLVRVVADGNLRMPLTATLLATAAEAPVWVLTRPGCDPDRARGFERLGAALLPCAPGPVGVDVTGALRILGARGITRLLVEGGAQIAASLLREGLVDRLAWFHAPCVMGGDGYDAVRAFGVTRLDHMPGFRRAGSVKLGADMLTTFERIED
jgi:diaminohydroxyphosphoribosylaminopyrimidine deaminase/5-amino-6-(5-phosphoribosylamino)uracil reductase